MSPRTINNSARINSSFITRFIAKATTSSSHVQANSSNAPSTTPLVNVTTLPSGDTSHSRGKKTDSAYDEGTAFHPLSVASSEGKVPVMTSNASHSIPPSTLDYNALQGQRELLHAFQAGIAGLRAVMTEKTGLAQTDVHSTMTTLQETLQTSLQRMQDLWAKELTRTSADLKASVESMTSRLNESIRAIATRQHEMAEREHAMLTAISTSLLPSIVKHLESIASKQSVLERDIHAITESDMLTNNHGLTLMAGPAHKTSARESSRSLVPHSDTMCLGLPPLDPIRTLPPRPPSESHIRAVHAPSPADKRKTQAVRQEPVLLVSSSPILAPSCRSDAQDIRPLRVPPPFTINPNSIPTITTSAPEYRATMIPKKRFLPISAMTTQASQAMFAPPRKTSPKPQSKHQKTSLIDSIEQDADEIWNGLTQPIDQGVLTRNFSDLYPNAFPPVMGGLPGEWKEKVSSRTPALGKATRSSSTTSMMNDTAPCEFQPVTLHPKMTIADHVKLKVRKCKCDGFFEGERDNLGTLMRYTQPTSETKNKTQHLEG